MRNHDKINEISNHRWVHRYCLTVNNILNTTNTITMRLGTVYSILLFQKVWTPRLLSIMYSHWQRSYLMNCRFCLFVPCCNCNSRPSLWTLFHEFAIEWITPYILSIDLFVCFYQLCTRKIIGFNKGWHSIMSRGRWVTLHSLDYKIFII